MIERTCSHCGTAYQTAPSHNLQYCSHRCASNAKARGETVACAQCGGSYYRHASRPARLYCSKSCARTALNLTKQNPAFQRDISGVNNPMFGIKKLGANNPMFGRRAEKAPRWNGGRRIMGNLYVHVLAPPNHPYPSDVKPSGTKYILEHRLVMEQALGRYLTPEEVVHHRNGCPYDNRIENLELLPSQQAHLALHRPSHRPARRPTKPK